MTGQIIFAPYIAWWLIYVLFGVVTLSCAVAFWKGLRGYALRLLAGIALVVGLMNPSYENEVRTALSDIVLLIEDRSASQELGNRNQQTTETIDQVSRLLAARPNTDIRKIVVNDSPDDGGTGLMAGIATLLSQEPQGRVAGVIAVTDGIIHDTARAPDFPAPVHVLLTGEHNDWDRKLTVENAPAFAILGEPITLSIRVDDVGNAPQLGRTSLLEIAVDGGTPAQYEIVIGQTANLPVTLSHGGRNVIQFSIPAADGELTTKNNSALVQINGVRDRLRVLLVSGEPHSGGRTWRNLLKSDSSVDLVHFTILRPPEKQDGVPVGELSLIAFPTRELFLEKIDDFDLIIFDRYKRRGILPALYLENVQNYVQKGGALLIAAGPDFASAESIYRSPLAPIMPAHPSARVIEMPFSPTISELGQRHPVTKGLDSNPEGWGRWLRQIEVIQDRGDAVMTGIDGRPLLILDRVGEGRVALLASDQAWLWDRGYEGGGPQLELLRRLAHWMMKEPELEEEALLADVQGDDIIIQRRTLKTGTDSVQITDPDGTTSELALVEVEPGLFEGQIKARGTGLYRVNQTDKETVIGVGPAAAKEFERTIASQDILAPIIKPTGGAVFQLFDGVPSLRDVRAGRPSAGQGWMGLTNRNAYRSESVSITPLTPPWLMMLVIAGLAIGAWLWEGRRSKG